MLMLSPSVLVRILESELAQPSHEQASQVRALVAPIVMDLFFASIKARIPEKWDPNIYGKVRLENAAVCSKTVTQTRKAE